MSSLTDWTLDHVVIVVDDLDDAVARFQALGFQVTRGGRTGPVHNALIYLADSTYIELTCPVSRGLRTLFRVLRGVGLLRLLARLRPGLMHRFYDWFGGPAGLRDWCVRVPSLEACRQHAEAAGIGMAETRPFQRVRPDGAVAQWRLTAPLDHSEPFWIEDTSPVDVRVPWRGHCAHPNGAQGIHAVVVSAAPRTPLGSVPLRVDTALRADRLRLELKTTGERSGLLPRADTSDAWIALV